MNSQATKRMLIHGNWIVCQSKTCMSTWVVSFSDLVADQTMGIQFLLNEKRKASALN